MNQYAIAIEAALALALLTVAAGTGYHLGGLASKTALEADHVAQLQAVVKAMDDNAREAAADHAHLQGVIDHYDATPIDPIVPGAAHRVYVFAAAACGGAVPKAGTVAGTVPGAASVALGPSEVERRLDDYIRACDADARRLTALQALAPNGK